MIPITKTLASDTNTWESCSIDGVPTLKCIEVVFAKILTISSSIALLVLFSMFIIGGFMYITSRGNQEQVSKAKGTLTYAVIGIIIFVSSYLILKIIDVLFLGGQGSILIFQIPDYP